MFQSVKKYLLKSFFGLGIGLALSGCGGFKSKPIQNSSSKPAVTSEAQQPGELPDSIFNTESEDDYDNAFSEVNDQILPEVPFSRDDLTPIGDIKNQAQGKFAAGRLINPSNLFLRMLSFGNNGLNAPFKILYPHRRAFFGTSDLIDMIDYVAQMAKRLIPDQRLMVGDLSAEHGGKLGSHLSHQIGMDVDLGYLVRPPRQTDHFASVTNVTDVGQSIYLQQQLQLFKKTVQTEKVDRIFIHPKIKRALCKTARELGAFDQGQDKEWTIETLRRLIPEVNHYNHFHLRVKCSPSQPKCIPMEEPETGSGCDRL